MTKDLMREIAEQAIRELNLEKVVKVITVKRPPYEADPTWWIDFTERDSPHVFQVFVPLEADETGESIKEKIKRQLRERLGVLLSQR